MFSGWSVSRGTEPARPAGCDALHLVARSPGPGCSVDEALPEGEVFRGAVGSDHVEAPVALALRGTVDLKRGCHEDWSCGVAWAVLFSLTIHTREADHFRYSFATVRASNLR